MAWLPWRRRGEPEADYPLARFRREIQRMADDFYRGWWAAPWTEGSVWAPALDVRETESEIVVELEAAGMKPEELDVSLTNGTLTIRGERKSEREEKEESYHLRERSYGSFCRTVSLPSGVDAEKASSRFENGVLAITLPKSEQARPMKIEVKA
jgi:HSP20 family protein